MKLLELLDKAAASISDGDMVDVIIRRVSIEVHLGGRHVGLSR